LSWSCYAGVTFAGSGVQAAIADIITLSSENPTAHLEAAMDSLPRLKTFLRNPAVPVIVLAAVLALLPAYAAAEDYIIATAAGGAPPPTPATALNVGLSEMEAIAADASGNAYFIAYNYLFKLDSAGILTRVAGRSRMPGFAGDGGEAINAQFYDPKGVAVDTFGNVYIADTGNNRIRKVTKATGVISTVAGTGISGYSGDGGPATAARLAAPQGIAVDGAGALFIADYNNRRVRKVAANTGVITTVAGNGSYAYSGDGGAAVSASFKGPEYVAIDAGGNLFIADTSNYRVRKVAAATGTVTTVAGNGTYGSSGDGGPATSAQLGLSYGMVVDQAGNVLIGENSRVRRVNAGDGIIATVAGGGSNHGDGGLATGAALGSLRGLALDSQGNLLIAEFSKVRKVAAATGIISTVAGSGGTSYSGDGGPATSAQLASPQGIAADAAGNLFIADFENHRIRKVTAATGLITTVAGNGTSGSGGDGGLATLAAVGYPLGVAVDGGGNLYIAHASRIRKVSAATGIITTIGGGGSADPGNGGLATAAQIDPWAVAVDNTGNVFFVELYRSRVYKISAATGIITPIAGNGTSGFSGDGGPATAAQLDSPEGIAVDNAGNVFIADWGNNRIRMVAAATGTITTVAGNGTLGMSGDGGLATQAAIIGLRVAVDSAGNLYIADFALVRKVSAATRIITSIGGSGYSGVPADGVLATSSLLDSMLYGLAVDGQGNVFVNEYDYSTIRVLLPTAGRAVLSAAKSHAGNFSPGQSNATYSVVVSNHGLAGATSGAVTLSELPPAGMTVQSMTGAGWNCATAPSTCTRSDALAPGASYPPITVAVNLGAGVPALFLNQVLVTGGNSRSAGASDAAVLGSTAASPTLSVSKTHSGTFAPGQTGAQYIVTVGNAVSAPATSGTVTVTEMVPDGLIFVSMSGTGWTCAGITCTRTDALSPGANYPPIIVTVNVAANAASPQVNRVTVSGGGSAPATADDSTTIYAFSSTALQFYPVTPCRVVDTRPSEGLSGAFGPPYLSAGSTRSFPIPAGRCNIPATAAAYSLNTTVVPRAMLGYLSIWPTGQSRPLVSTLNSLDGRVAANAAIVPAGAAGAVDVYVTHDSELILDINGYFAPPSIIGLQFYPVTPCRIADTRASGGKSGAFGPPRMTAGSTRSFTLPAASCGIPATAAAYSLNMTVVPMANLGYLSVWPAGQTRPLVSTLNSPKGTVVANAAIVPAGTGGAISLYVSDDSEVLFDISGYFAPSSTSGLNFYPLTPCRVADTRYSGGFAGMFGPPALAANTTRSFPVVSSACGVPFAAAAYSLNMTVVPDGFLGYLSVWPSGLAQPLVSTLNSFTGTVVANAAIVPTGAAGVATYVTDRTELVIDINGYFAP
jgi:trimeric autotransporter adhesin